LTSQQIQIVSETWTDVSKRRQEFAKQFYARLFELAPALRPLFKADMIEQEEKLSAMLDVVLLKLNAGQDIVAEIRELGLKHRHYGVTRKDYEPVGAALLWALRQQLKAKFNSRVEDAWTAAYVFIAGEMQAGAA
jgi:hemoglobin-like flavoprotein